MKSIFVLWIVIASTAWTQTASTRSSPPAKSNSVYPQVQTLYMDLHQHPELSLHEVNTAAKLAARLRELGYDVTEKVGGTGWSAFFATGPDRRSCCAPSWTHFRSREDRLLTQAQSTLKTMPVTTFR